MNSSGDKLIRQQVGNMQVSFDKEAAWLRLQEKMESRDEKKGYSRLGWVAAIVILLGLGVWYSLQNDPAPVATAAEPTGKARSGAITDPQEKNNPPIAPDKPQEPAHTKAHVAIKKKSKVQVQRQVKEAGSIATVDEIHEPPMPAKETAIAETPLPVEKEKPVASKPKMRTVHISEVMEEEWMERREYNRRYAGQKTLFFQKTIHENDDGPGTPGYLRARPFTPFNNYGIIQN